MTLFIRLFLACLFFVPVSFISYKVLFPHPAYYGDYQSINKAGTYKLRIESRNSVMMSFLDQQNNKFIYAGDLQARDNNRFFVSWNRELKNEEWLPLRHTAQEQLRFVNADTIQGAEGTFHRIPETFWKRWFSL